MATVTRYVNTASSAGGDGTTNNTTGATRAYVSKNEWEAAEEVDLVSAGDIHHVYCEGATDDTTTVAVSGWTTDASNYIIIETTLANSSKGIQGAGHQHVVSQNFGYTMDVSQVYTRIIHQDLVNNGDSGAAAMRDAVDNIFVDYCLMEGGARGGLYEPKDGSIFRCCLFLNSGDGGVNGKNNESPVFENCGAAGNTGDGFQNGGSGSSMELYNCWTYNNGGTNYNASGGSWGTSSNNAADDYTTNGAPGSPDVTDDIVSGDFNNATGNDFHLSGTSSNLYHVGATVSGLTLDIDGHTYHATTPSVGFDEVVAGGVTIDLTTATFGFTAQAPQPSLSSALSTASISFSALAIQGSLLLALASSSLSLSAQSLQPSVLVSLTSAALSFTANAISLLVSTVIDLTAATLSLTAKAITVTGAVAVDAGVVLKKVLRKVLREVHRKV